MEQNATIQSYEPLEEVQTRPTLFKPKLNLSLEAAHNQVKNAHRIEEHEGTMSFCRTCRIEFERLISDEVYKKMRYNHGKDEHAGHVFMCNVCHIKYLKSSRAIVAMSRSKNDEC